MANPHASNDLTAVVTPDGWAINHIAASQTCPVCFSSVAKHATRENRGIMLADYVCNGITQHLWSVRWGLAQTGTGI